MDKRLILTIIFALFLLFLIVPVISAVPKVTTTQQFSEGYIINAPFTDLLKKGEDLTLHFHIFNISNGKLITNSTANCFILVKDVDGSDLIELTPTGQEDHFQFIILAGNFTEIGRTYGYTIHCNSSSFGGFVSGNVLLTYSGKELTEGNSILYIGFIGILLFIFFITLYGINKLPQRNKRDEEGKILSISYLKYFRDVLWMFEWMLILVVLYISSNLAFVYLGEQLFAKMLFVLFQIGFALTPIIVILWVIWIIVSMFHDKQLQKMISRGIFPQGKL